MAKMAVPMPTKRRMRKAVSAIPLIMIFINVSRETGIRLSPII